MSAFGDSFTHGDEVGNDDTWPAALEREVPGLEVLNFGVPGYGPGQAYLRYRTLGRRFPSDIVLIGLMSENVHRAVNRYRPFYTASRGLPFSKPRFILRDGELRLIENPLRTRDDYEALIEDPVTVLRRLAADDGQFGDRYYARRFDWSPAVRLLSLAVEHLPAGPAPEEVFVDGAYNPASETFQVTRAILDAFCAEVLADGAVPVIVLLPNRADIVGRRSGRPAHYRTLMDHFEREGYRYADVYEAFGDTMELDSLLLAYHYSPRGNELVARHLADVVTALAASDR